MYCHTITLEKFQKKHIDANLVECGIEVGVPNVGYQYTVIKDAVLHIVTNGEGTFKCQDVEHHLKEGDIFLLKKGETVEYYPSFSNPWTYYWLGVGKANYQLSQSLSNSR